MKILSPKDLGRAIRNRRKSMGLSQGELAKRLVVSQPWVSDVENGKEGASIGGILRVIAHLNLLMTIGDRNVSATTSLPSINDLTDNEKR